MWKSWTVVRWTSGLGWVTCGSAIRRGNCLPTRLRPCSPSQVGLGVHLSQGPRRIMTEILKFFRCAATALRFVKSQILTTLAASEFTRLWRRPMSDPFAGWPEPELNEEEQRAFLIDTIKTGIRFFIFTTITYAFLLWVISILLFNSNIIDGSISWLNSCIIAFIGTFARVWDRTFFK